MAKQLFNSRGKARKYAAEHGGQVKDRGRFFDNDRWAVVGAGEVIGKINESPEVDMSFTSEATPSTISRFFESRGDAREFAKGKKNAKIIDHAKTSDGRDKHEQVIKDLGKRGQRWEVVVEAVDLHIEAVVTLTPEPDRIPVDVEEVAPKADPIVIMTLKNISVTLADGKQLVMSRDHEDFKKVAALFADGDVEAMIEIMNVEKKQREWQFGKDICVIEGKLYHYGMVVADVSIARRIINDCEAGQNPEKFVNFFRKLMKNPSFKAVQHTYDFIRHNDLEILEDGDIRAWKKVSHEGFASRNVPNFKGMTIMMPRNQVEDDPQKTCSAGLHVAAKEYFTSGYFNNCLLIEVSVSPADIVSVPVDYNNSKCRSCRYTVLTGLDRPDHIPKVLLIDKDGNRVEEINEDE